VSASGSFAGKRFDTNVKKKTIVTAALTALLCLLAGGVYLSSREKPLPLNVKAHRLLVLKQQHQLLLLDGGDNVIKIYAVAIGRGGLAPKERLGDHRTPVGIYQIDHRKLDSRFHRALHVSYPNDSDRQRASKLGVNPGGDIMIHGLMNGLGWLGPLHRMVDWTDGCVAVTNAEIEEIWSAVPDGTPVEIRP
jgi:murein L,D-transpeptidase YafK